MQLLGPSVEALWWAAGAGTGLETGSALRLGAGMLRCLRGLHACGWTHNDVKPANFCMGPGGKGGEGGKGGAASRVHLVDFGLCAPVAAAAAVDWSAPPPPPRVPPRSQPPPTALDECGDAGAGAGASAPAGTPLFSSVAQQQRRPTRPSDDVCSLVYSLCYLMRGRLPWEQLELQQGATAVLEAKRKVGRDGVVLVVEYPGGSTLVALLVLVILPEAATLCVRGCDPAY